MLICPRKTFTSALAFIFISFSASSSSTGEPAGSTLEQNNDSEFAPHTRKINPATGKLMVSDYGTPCNDRHLFRNAYFGDLHVHTSLSLDAYQQGVRTSPDDAYNFARGKTIPFHDSNIAIDRPLDFIAVTDHAKHLGDIESCLTAVHPEYDSEVCDRVRHGSGAAFKLLERSFQSDTKGTRSERVLRALGTLFKSEDPKRNIELCGANGESCVTGASNAWKTIISSAERAQDRSKECSFSSFIAYEYTGTKTGSNYHRNVIFRNNKVPSLPVSYLDAPLDYLLWQQLDQSCSASIPGCDYLTIPHNSNLSNGILLTPDYSSAANEAGEKRLALIRQKSEPLMEIYQHKGQSECINGITNIEAETDALCDFEQVRKIGSITRVLDTMLVTEECTEATGSGGMINTGCISRNDYLRGALLTGLEEGQRLGVNPLKLGVIASTDTHESTPGAVDEQTWQGHVGRERELPLRLQRKTGLPYRLVGSPGGLAGVWAIENSREAIFDALKRRETFATSGPRIKPRFFAGWHYESNMCEHTAYLDQAYQGGVPMGGDLPSPPRADSKPGFFAAAIRDPQGNPLHKLQLIKGWIDSTGRAHVEVIDIAGHTGEDANVVLETGDIKGPGYDSLCTVYIDRTFKPGVPAYYYLRVVENPSPRWSWAQCMAIDKPLRPRECDNDAVKTIQERAWTSPIWYQLAD